MSLLSLFIHGSVFEVAFFFVDIKGSGQNFVSSPVPVKFWGIETVCVLLISKANVYHLVVCLLWNPWFHSFLLPSSGSFGYF